MSNTHVEDTRVDVDGGRIFVRQWTPDAAASVPPLVLLHDSLGSVELWRDFPAALARCLGRRVIAYDRLGFGRSSACERAPSLDFILEEAQAHFPALRDALGLERYGLFGHSVGGAMAVVIAALDGTRCRLIVTESAQAFVEARTLDGIRAAQAQFENADAFARLERWHGAKARWVLDAWTQAWLDPAFADWNLDAWLPRVCCPVLAIHGDRDEYGSAAFPERIARGVQGPAECVILDGCGHVPHRERPERVLALVSRFLASGLELDLSK
jgi:pimeloyl-ACP methyl ester carboxylesterase